MNIEKNLKFKTGFNCMGTVYINPYFRVDNIKLSRQYERTSIQGAWTTRLDMPVGTDELDLQNIAKDDVMLIGGQVTGYFQSYAEDEQGGIFYITMMIPNGTYLFYDTGSYYATDPALEREYDNVYFFRKNFYTSNGSCAFWYDGQDGSLSLGCDSSTGEFDPNAIRGCSISSYQIIREQAVYGENSKVYSTNNKYKAALSLPYKTPLEQVNQLLQSEAIAFQADDRYTTDYDNDYNWEFVKPLGGGSISPLIRKFSLDTKNLTEIVRRDRYSITGTLEG